jgi:hypothetical protein
LSSLVLRSGSCLRTSFSLTAYVSIQSVLFEISFSFGESGNSEFQTLGSHIHDEHWSKSTIIRTIVFVCYESSDERSCWTLKGIICYITFSDPRAMLFSTSRLETVYSVRTYIRTDFENVPHTFYSSAKSTLGLSVAWLPFSSATKDTSIEWTPPGVWWSLNGSTSCIEIQLPQTLNGSSKPHGQRRFVLRSTSRHTRVIMLRLWARH